MTATRRQTARCPTLFELTVTSTEGGRDSRQAAADHRRPPAALARAVALQPAYLYVCSTYAYVARRFERANARTSYAYEACCSSTYPAESRESVWLVVDFKCFFLGVFSNYSVWLDWERRSVWLWRGKHASDDTCVTSAQRRAIHHSHQPPFTENDCEGRAAVAGGTANLSFPAAVRLVGLARHLARPQLYLLKTKTTKQQNQQGAAWQARSHEQRGSWQHHVLGNELHQTRRFRRGR